MNKEQINYKQLYLERTKEYYALKITHHPYWDGSETEFGLNNKYSLEALENIWFRLVESEYENMSDWD